MTRIFVSLFVLAVLCSCKSVSVAGPGSGSVSYSDNAKQNFDLGVKALENDNTAVALAYFEYVRNKYPYSKYAGESDLKIGDAHFKDEKWMEAADAYDFFIRFHPAHEKLAYAYFRVAKSNFNAMPSNFFLYPPSYTKDQTATNDALQALDRYLKQFPNDENVKEATEMRVTLREQTALLHMSVAKFYTTLRKWKGAAQRYNEVVTSFADTPSAKAAMLQLAVLKKDRLEEVDEAKELLQRLSTDFSDSSEAAQARAMLERLDRT